MARRILLAVALGCGLATTIGGPARAQASVGTVSDQAACGPAAAGDVRCFAEEKARNGVVVRTATPTGIVPADIQAAYNLPATGAGQTVGIADAFDDPHAESDLAVYRAEFGLPACTTANGCFRKVAEHGGTNYPRPNKGWGVEISIDLQMVSAACPQCHIILVEAKNADLKSLGISVDTAISLGATEVSNSYGAKESIHNLTSFDALYYDHPGIPMVAATGDFGYGDPFIYPASSPYVTAVGGTNLSKDGSARGYSETAWSDTTSGCSRKEAKPSWQSDPGCSTRTVADVSAVADNVAIYDSYREMGQGWISAVGTSIGSPIIASVYALAGNGASIDDPSQIYSHTSSLYDVVSGSNGSCGTYLCNSGPGYDGPTGWGTPDGTAAF